MAFILNTFPHMTYQWTSRRDQKMGMIISSGRFLLGCESLMLLLTMFVINADLDVDNNLKRLTLKSMIVPTILVAIISMAIIVTMIMMLIIVMSIIVTMIMMLIIAMPIIVTMIMMMIITMPIIVTMIMIMVISMSMILTMMTMMMIIDHHDVSFRYIAEV